MIKLREIDATDEDAVSTDGHFVFERACGHEGCNLQKHKCCGKYEKGLAAENIARSEAQREAEKADMLRFQKRQREILQKEKERQEDKLKIAQDVILLGKVIYKIQSKSLRSHLQKWEYWENLKRHAKKRKAKSDANQKGLKKR